MRKKIVPILCLLLTALLLALLVWQAPVLRKRFPINREGSIVKQGWQGVLRVWVCQDWSSGTMAWLSKQASAFEKSHKGVHVSLRRVTADVWKNPDVVLPDLLIFSPGMIEEPEGFLYPLAGATNFYEEALRAGRWRGEQYAIPVSLGGYIVLVNEALWPEGTALSSPSGLKNQPRYALHCAQNGGLAAMGGWGEGIDAVRKFKLPQQFGQTTSDQAYSAFVSGSVAALICPVDTARKFAAREAAGKGFKFRVETQLSGFTDLILMAGRVRSTPDTARDSLADQLLWALTEPEAQKTITNYGMLPASTSVSHVGAETPTLQALYNRYQQELLIPNVFEWRKVRSVFWERARYAITQDVMSLVSAVEAVR